MSEEWYSRLNAEEINGKHVRVHIDDGTVVESYLVYDDQGGCVRLGDSVLPLPWESKSHKVFPSPAVLTYEDDECLYSLQGVESISLVWDERDWDRIGLDDIEAIDALVVAGRLYELVSHKPDCDLWQVRVPGEKHTASVSTAMISCALRRKVGAAEEHESSGPFESLVQYLIPKIPVSDGRAA